MKYGIQMACLGMVCAASAACGMKDSQSGKPKGATPSSSVRSVARRLAEIAGQANQAAPAAVDPNTRLDGAKAGPGLRLTTTYTLMNTESEGINSTTFKTRLTPAIETASCKNTDLRPLIDQGAVVVLEYRGNDGSPIGTISINRETCSAIR